MGGPGTATITNDDEWTLVLPEEGDTGKDYADVKDERSY